MFFDKVQNRINNTENAYKKYSIEQAEQFIVDVLSGETVPRNMEDELLLKENLLYALNTTMTAKFGLKQGEIKPKVKKLSGDALAEIRDLLGDNIYWLQVDSFHFEEGRVSEVMFSLLHEYGHINQIIREKQGKKVPKAIATKWNVYSESSPMAQLGVDLKYQMNKNEMDANKFAFKTYWEFLKKVELKDRKRPVYLEYVRYAIGQYLHKVGRKVSANILYTSWRLFNLKTDIEDIYSYVHVSNSLPERIYAQNLLLKGADFSLVIRQAKSKIERMQDPKYIAFYKSLNEENKLEYAINLIDGMMHQFLMGESIEPEKIGEAIIPSGSKEPITFQESKIEGCPLIGYFKLDVEKIGEINNPLKLVKSMEKAIKTAQTTIRANQLQNQ